MKNRRSNRFTMTEREKKIKKHNKNKIVFIPKFKSDYDRLLN